MDKGRTSKGKLSTKELFMGAHPNSIKAKLDNAEFKKYQKWIKELDADLAAAEREWRMWSDPHDKG